MRGPIKQHPLYWRRMALGVLPLSEVQRAAKYQEPSYHLKARILHMRKRDSHREASA